MWVLVLPRVTPSVLPVTSETGGEARFNNEIRTKDSEDPGHRAKPHLGEGN